MVNRQSCAKGGKCASKNAKMPKPKHVGLVAKDPYLEPYKGQTRSCAMEIEPTYR